MDRNILIGKKVYHRILKEGTIVGFDEEKKNIFYTQYDGEERVRRNFFPADILCGEVFRKDDVVFPLVQEAFFQCNDGAYIEIDLLDDFVLKCALCEKESNNIEDKIYFVKNYGLSLDKRDKAILCKECCEKIEIKKEKIKKEKEWWEAEKNKYFIMSLMQNSKPKDSKKRQIHDTDGMTVS